MALNHTHKAYQNYVLETSIFMLISFGLFKAFSRCSWDLRFLYRLSF